MIKKRSYPHITSIQKKQMLKLIAESFYKELANYGVTKPDVVSISANLLDHVMETDDCLGENCEYYNKELNINDISDEWGRLKKITYKNVSLVPIEQDMYQKIAIWLRDPSIKYNFVSSLPETEGDLKDYFNKTNNQYFSILFENKLEGIIGADNIDLRSSKVEMKKFIGNYDMQGKGIGKCATFLFLYYIFTIMKRNKIYIYTVNKNITNINLNGKFGFVLEGLLYQDERIQNEIQDIVRMGLLRSSWLKIFTEINRKEK